MAFIGIEIKPEISKLLSKIDVPGSITHDSEYHITIAYMGKDYSIKQVAKAMEITYETLQNAKPLHVELNKVSSFPKGPDGIPIFAEVKSKDLMDLNTKLKHAYDKHDIEYSKLHKDYHPHITLSYADEEFKDKKIEKIEFIVYELVLWPGMNGDEKFSIHFPLTEEKEKHSAYLHSKIDLFKYGVKHH